MSDLLPYTPTAPALPSAPYTRKTEDGWDEITAADVERWRFILRCIAEGERVTLKPPRRGYETQGYEINFQDEEAGENLNSEWAPSITEAIDIAIDHYGK